MQILKPSAFAQSLIMPHVYILKKMAYRAMSTAIKRAGVKAGEIDVIHAHGTSTVEGDLAEASAISRLFCEPGPAIMGTKSNFGHMMSGVGGIQVAALILAMKNQIVPHILNLEKPIKVGERVLDFVIKTPKQMKIKYGISNNAGF